MYKLWIRDAVLRVHTFELRDLDFSFEIGKSVKHEPNTASIKIRNLNRETRAAIEALSLKPKKEGLQSGQIRVELEAGFLDARPLLFRGDLRTAISIKQGPDVVTTIEGEDGGRAALMGRVSQSFPAGTPARAVIQACAAAMGVGLGNIADVAEKVSRTLPRGVQAHGKAHDKLASTLRGLGLAHSIQNNVLQFRDAGKALKVKAVVLRPPKDGAPGTGLVDSPARDASGVVTARALLIPELIPGGRVLFDTEDLVGQYKIQKVRYTGDTAGTDWYADIECKADV